MIDCFEVLLSTPPWRRYTKVELLAACVRRKVRVLACGGAGAKCDPTRIRIVDIAESVADPLARAVRHRLKRDHGIEGKGLHSSTFLLNFSRV